MRVRQREGALGSIESVRALAYIRVSREEQAREGVSLDAQRDRVAAYATAKGLILVDVIADEGRSGKDVDRPGLQSLLARCRAGEAGHVIVWRLDRLTRSARDLLGLVDDLFLARHIELHSVSESLDTSTPHGRFVLTLFGALAEMERGTIAERTRAALAFKRELGQPTSHAPLGFASRGRRERMAPVPEELMAVRRLLELWSSGYSYRAIAVALNSEGIPTKHGGLWRHSTIGGVIRGRKRYAELLEVP